jgi:nucleotide-binding universal stress UspA family protein
MGPIVCATRGGERGAPLVFLFVADTNFAQPSNSSLADALADELERLGRGLLYIARSRAEEQDVSAEMVVRHGAVRQTIVEFLREVQASALVLGAPGTGTEKKTFSPRELPQFAQEINSSTGVEVIVVG